MNRKKDKAIAEEQAKEAEDLWYASANEREVESRTNPNIVPMTVQEILDAPINEKQKPKLIENAENVTRNNPVKEAEFSSRISLKGDVTSEELWASVPQSNGISLEVARKLDAKIKELAGKGKAKNPIYKGAYQVALDAKRDNVFDENETANSIGHAELVIGIDEFIAENPNLKPKEYVEFVENILTEPKQEWSILRIIESTLNAITPGQRFQFTGPSPVAEIDERTKAIQELKAIGAVIDEENISEAVRQLKEQGELE
jgi:hypothetical protein